MIGPNYVKEGKIFNRTVRVTKEGWKYEADQRHGEVIVESLKLAEANEVSSPGEDAKSWEEEENAENLMRAWPKERSSRWTKTQRPQQSNPKTSKTGTANVENKMG